MEARIPVPAGQVRLGLAARIPADTPQYIQEEVRRLLLAEHAMLAIGGWAEARLAAPSPADRFAQGLLVDAAGLAVTFARPFMQDDKKNRLDRDEWRSRLEVERPDLVDLFDRILARRNRIFAHADTTAGMTNVTNTHKMFGSRAPDDPIDLRVYDVGAADEILSLDVLQATGELASTLAQMFSARMVELGAERVSSLRDSV
jgi:hypothetical protein